VHGPQQHDDELGQLPPRERRLHRVPSAAGEYVHEASAVDYALARRRLCRVRAALRADCRRAAGDRRFAALRAWRASDLRDAAFRPSRFSAARVARDRFADVFLRP
jgi:hypothetical protein